MGPTPADVCVLHLIAGHQEFRVEPHDSRHPVVHRVGPRHGEMTLGVITMMKAETPGLHVGVITRVLQGDMTTQIQTILGVHVGVGSM